MDRPTLYRLEAATGMAALLMLTLTLICGVATIWCAVAWAVGWAGASWLCVFGGASAACFAGLLVASNVNGWIERKIAKDVASSIDAHLDQYR